MTKRDDTFYYETSGGVGSAIKIPELTWGMSSALRERINALLATARADAPLSFDDEGHITLTLTWHTEQGEPLTVLIEELPEPPAAAA